MTSSGLTGQGVEAIWEKISDHRALMIAAGDWESRRSDQKVRWMWALIEDRLIHRLREDPKIAATIGDLEKHVNDGSMTPFGAADRVLSVFDEIE